MNQTDFDTDINSYDDCYDDLYDMDAERRFAMIVAELAKAEFGPKNIDME